ncbi:terminase, partial [Xenorhabdus bovienii]
HADLAWATMHALFNEPITGDTPQHRNIVEVY